MPVFIGLVVVTYVDYILVSFGRRRERLKADVECTSVSGPAHDLGLFPAMSSAARISGQHCAGRLEGRMHKWDFHVRVGKGPGDHCPATGRNRHDGVWLEI